MSFNFQIESQVKVYANSGAFPATGLIRTIYIDKANDTAYYWNDDSGSYKSLGGGTGSIVWGAITGTLANQTDLQNALNAKVPYTGATANVDLGEYQMKVGQIELDQTPTGTTGVAKIRWNDTDGTIDVGLKGGNVTLQVGLEELVRVVNKSGVTLAESAYQAVRVRLVSEGGASGQRLAVVLAQANNDLNSATTIGLVTESIANNQEGFINRGGEVRNINTTGSLQGETWVDGDILYLSPTTPGAITNIKPTAPNHSIVLGYVVYSHAVNGKIFVKVDNGYELEELHNVTADNYTAPVDADSLLILDNAASLWKRLTWANVKAKLKTYFDTIYQDEITLTTTGTSGAATLVGATLNIPQYSGGGGASGIHALVKPISGRRISNALTSIIVGNQFTTSRLFLYPFFPANTFTISEILMCGNIAVAGSLCRLLIYSDNNGFPDAKLFESANLDLSTTGFKIATTTFTFNAGTTYWLGFHGGAITANVVCNTVAAVYQMAQSGSSPNGVNGYNVTAALGSAPANITTATLNVGIPQWIGLTPA